MAQYEVKDNVKAINAWRKDFPALAKDMSGKPLVYLDTSASALKPNAVIDTMSDVMRTHYSNIHRGLYEMSQITTRKYEEAREKVAHFIHANSENEIVFTRNGTESINLVVHAWGRQNLKKGDVVLLSELEHHANIVPWYLLAQEIGFEIDVLPINDACDLDMNVFKTKIQNPKVKFLSVTQMSNALGTITPVKEMIALAKENNVLTLLDGCQAIMHGKVDVQNLGCDFYIFSGHKLYGPSGIGILWGKYDLLQSMTPYQGGGDMIDHVAFEKITFKDAPGKFEAGTPAIVEAIGLGAAIDYLNSLGMDKIAEHEKQLFEYLLSSLQSINDLRIIGSQKKRGGAVSFLMDCAHPQDIATILDKQGIAVRVGHHCAEPLMAKLGIDATVRASIGLYSTREDVDALVAGLQKVKQFFQ